MTTSQLDKLVALTLAAEALTMAKKHDKNFSPSDTVWLALRAVEQRLRKERALLSMSLDDYYAYKQRLFDKELASREAKL